MFFLLKTSSIFQISRGKDRSTGDSMHEESSLGYLNDHGAKKKKTCSYIFSSTSTRRCSTLSVASNGSRGTVSSTGRTKMKRRGTISTDLSSCNSDLSSCNSTKCKVPRDLEIYDAGKSWKSYLITDNNSNDVCIGDKRCCDCRLCNAFICGMGFM